MNPAILIDGYKTSHAKMYPDGTEYIYSNWTPRKSRIDGANSIRFFGLQYFIKKYLIEEWNENFFGKSKEKVVGELAVVLRNFCDDDIVRRLGELHDLGYLPLLIKSLPEGDEVPIGVPCFTIVNTHPKFFWLTNFMETILSCSIWQACTSATIANRFRKMLDKYALQSDPDNKDFVQFQGHDFSMRGMSSLESACLSGAGHLLSFTGTDTIPTTLFLANYYGADLENELVGCGCSASEHSVMSMSFAIHGDEVETFRDLIVNKFPSGIISIVSDTFSLWDITCRVLPQLKEDILNRDGKVVIRPDSSRTTPEDIVCGTPPELRTWSYENEEWNKAEELGLVQCLWNIFGGSVNSAGYKVLSPRAGGIYGDAVSYDRAEEICQRLMKNGFASTNIVFGIGSYTYQYNTRDTLGFAMKATYGVHQSNGYDLFKDPATDSGEKKSAKGMISVHNVNGQYIMLDGVNEAVEASGCLRPVFYDGKLVKETTLTEIRERIKK